MKPSDIFDSKLIEKMVKEAKPSTEQEIATVLSKAAKRNGLSLTEVNILISAPRDLDQQIFATAKKIKQEIYGERLVMFAPLYVSDFCVNNCSYCNFHTDNKTNRRKLTMDELVEETQILIKMGHKRLLLEFGEHLVECPIEYVTKVINEIYETKSGNGKIRRVNVNIAATTTENYRKLKEAGIGTYQLFQETYHRPTYEKIHSGPKADYERQLFAHDRAFAAGIDDLGLGVLYGLYDWRYELLALISHANYLDRKYGVGPHTVSFPRINPAPTVNFQPAFPVSDENYLKIIAIVRLALPYTGMIISTRETPGLRAKAFEIGISQTSGGSIVDVGGYHDKAKSQKPKVKSEEVGQFEVHDGRNLDQMVYDICRQGYLPSFCTACYRQGRTGDKFMELAKPGEIHNLCRPNAILTFKEYLLDYASPKTKVIGEKIIAKYLDKIDKPEIKMQTLQKLDRIVGGERDIYF